MFFKPISLWRVFSLHFNPTSSIPKIKGFYHVSSLSCDCRLIFLLLTSSSTLASPLLFLLKVDFNRFSRCYILVHSQTVYYLSTKTLPLLNKVAWFNPWRFPSGMLDKAHLSERVVFVDFMTFLFPFSLSDFSYAQLGWRGVWDSSHYASTRDGVRSRSVGRGLTFLSNARAPGSTQGPINPPVPPSEPGAALHYHLTQHDGPGSHVCQQRATCGEHSHAFIQVVNQEVYLFAATREILICQHTKSCTSTPPACVPLVAAVPDVLTNPRYMIYKYILLETPDARSITSLNERFPRTMISPSQFLVCLLLSVHLAQHLALFTAQKVYDHIA